MYLNNISNERIPLDSTSPINSFPQCSPQNIWLSAQQREVISKIAPFLGKVAFSAGDYIHQPDDSTDYIYFPETAVISEFQILKDGRAVGTSLYGDESILGLLSIFDSHPADTWTQVLLSGSAYRIKAEIFKAKLMQHQSLQMLMFEYVNNHIKQLTQRVVCNSYHTLEERFCSFLLMMQERRKNCGLSITQEQIAYFLGTHRPSITQIAQNLRTRKIINYARRNLVINDREKLKEAACDCYVKNENQTLPDNRN
jgi:CRP-like cAMP-binding protein